MYLCIYVSMYKQMNKLPLLIVLWVLLLGVGESVARAPMPFCASKPLYKKFPLTMGEKLSYDMATAFTGYNLSVRLAPSSINSTITNKFALLDTRAHNYTKVISHYVEELDNTVGKDVFLLYTDASNTTFINYGQIKDSDHLPTPASDPIAVTSDPLMQCFDAALFLDHGIIIVDCLKIEKKFAPLSNYFIFINIATKEKLMVPNRMYSSFTTITKRRFTKFSHAEAGGFTYLLRTYLADGVDAANAGNTYMEVWSVPVTAPLQAQLLRVIDRSVLGLTQLRIMDVELYLDDIFVLDEGTGVFRLDIRLSQRIEVLGRYLIAGYSKLAVYSDDLQDEVLLSIANRHTVHEIDWHNVGAPVLMRSFSIMENSTVKQLLMNNDYVIVQSSADAMNSTHPHFTLNYTWVFRRDARTYTTAYHVIDHNTSQVQITLDRLNSKLYIADLLTSSLYSLNAAVLEISFNDAQKIGKTQLITVVAESIDSITNVIKGCQEAFQVSFTNIMSDAIYATGIAVNDLYSVNFPGQLDIFLDTYYLGAQLQYKIKHLVDDVPNAWVNKLNETKVTFSKAIRPAETTFFHTDVVEQLGREVVIYYYQDIFNKTSVAECTHPWYSQDLQCSVLVSYQHPSRIASLITVPFYRDNDFYYYYIMVLSGRRNIINAYDYFRNVLELSIVYPQGPQGQIYSLSSSNGYLYVLLKNIKTVDVYDLRTCTTTSCKRSFSINAGVAKGLGINYFTPQEIVTDRSHPQVLFLRCVGLVAIIDIDNKNKLHLLDMISTTLTEQKYYSIAVNRDTMLLVAPPDLMHQYSLDNLYLNKKLTMRKTLPSYGYTIQPQADLQFSDTGSLAYINVMDTNQSVSAILVFRLGYSAATVLYSIITLDKLYSRPGFQIEVSGTFVDFLTIISGEKLTCYRVFEYPFISINNTFFNYSFQIEVSNKKSTMRSDQVNVTVTNFASKIQPTALFNSTLLSAGEAGDYTYEDRNWFKGSGVVNYSYSCKECGSKVKLRQHIDSLTQVPVGGNSYTQTVTGGFAILNDLYRFRPNGSVWEVINLPDQSMNEMCVKITAEQRNTYVISACNHRGVGVNLYITSMASVKGFTWGPYTTDAVNVRTLTHVEDILMLVDVPQNPQYFFRQGSVFLYRISFDHTTQQQFNQIEQIDSKDFVGCAGWQNDQVYIVSNLMSVSLAHNLSLILLDGFSAQSVSITAVNDVSSFTFTIEISPKDKEDKLFLYIIIGLCGVVIVAFAIYVYRVHKKKRMVNQERQSLISGVERSVLEINRENKDTYQPPRIQQQQSQEQQEEQQEQQQEQQQDKSTEVLMKVVSSQELPLPKRQNLQPILIQTKKQTIQIQPINEKLNKSEYSSQQSPLPRKQMQVLPTFQSNELKKQQFSTTDKKKADFPKSPLKEEGEFFESNEMVPEMEQSEPDFQPQVTNVLAPDQKEGEV